MPIKRELKPIHESKWETWTSEAKVIGDMLKTSGLQDKTVALEIDVDAALLSKAQNGGARLSEKHMDALMDACGSEAWLHYWMLKRGYDPRCLRRLENDLERENRLLREKLEKLESEQEVVIRFLKKSHAL